MLINFQSKHKIIYVVKIPLKTIFSQEKTRKRGREINPLQELVMNKLLSRGKGNQITPSLYFGY